MKIRVGYVSNSSSVSFCVYGVSLDSYYKEDKDIMRKIEENMCLTGLANRCFN